MLVVGVCCTPRKSGNTYALVSACCLSAAEQAAGHAQVFELHYDLNLNRCDACDSCHTVAQRCHLTDDLTPVLAALEQADAIVTGSPVYNGIGTPELALLVARSNALLDVDGNTSRLAGKVGAAIAVGQMSQDEQVEHGGQRHVLHSIAAFYETHGVHVVGIDGQLGVTASTGGDIGLSAVRAADPAAMDQCVRIGAAIARLLGRA